MSLERLLHDLELGNVNYDTIVATLKEAERRNDRELYKKCVGLVKHRSEIVEEIFRQHIPGSPFLSELPLDWLGQKAGLEWVNDWKEAAITDNNERMGKILGKQYRHENKMQGTGRTTRMILRALLRARFANTSFHIRFVDVTQAASMSTIRKARKIAICLPLNFFPHGFPKISSLSERQVSRVGRGLVRDREGIYRDHAVREVSYYRYPMR